MTLARVLETEVMDTPEEARDYDAMDHREVNRLFAADLLAALAADVAARALDAPPLEILDLGTGTAQIPVELCRQSDAVRVAAIDMAVSMLDLAILNIETAGFRDRIMLDRVDAKLLPYESGRFAAAVSNSIVHHIPQPALVLREAVRVTAPGGLIFMRDLLRPQDEETVRRLVDTYAAGASEHARSMFAASLHAALSLEEIRSMVAALGFARESVQATSDRHWTWSAGTASTEGLSGD